MKAKIRIIDIKLPWQSEAFEKALSDWQQYKSEQHNFRYKSALSMQGFLNRLATISGGVEATAIAFIYGSIAQGWQGVYPVKTETNESPTNTGQTAYERRRAEMAERIKSHANNSGLFPG